MIGSDEMLSGLKVNLGIVATAYDERLLSYLDSAKQRIEREGITLTDTVEDTTLVIQYAAWMWQDRDKGTGMPRMIRYALNNRLFSEKMKE
jgi:hypothetical protein